MHEFCHSNCINFGSWAGRGIIRLTHQHGPKNKLCTEHRIMFLWLSVCFVCGCDSANVCGKGRDDRHSLIPEREPDLHRLYNIAEGTSKVATSGVTLRGAAGWWLISLNTLIISIFLHPTLPSPHLNIALSLSHLLNTYYAIEISFLQFNIRLIRCYKLQLLCIRNI